MRSNNDVAGFVEAMKAIQRVGQAAKVASQQAEIDMMNADPFDPEVQAKIAEHIRQEHVAHNYTQAMENNPEARANLPPGFFAPHAWLNSCSAHTVWCKGCNE